MIGNDPRDADRVVREQPARALAQASPSRQKLLQLIWESDRDDQRDLRRWVPQSTNPTNVP